jgi:hypothetical protein
MLELEEQLAQYGDYLDSLDADATVSTVSGVTRRRRRLAIVAIAACVAVLGVGAVWLVAHQGASSGPRVSPADSAPISDPPPTTTATTAGEPDIATVQLSPEQQVDWLTQQHETEASVHLPGWRTELSAERVACDFAGVPGLSVQSFSGSASDFPLGEAIAADRIIQACANGTDATRSAGIDLTSQGTLCKSVSTKRVAGPTGAAEPTDVADVVVTEPAVIFTGGSCEASGYETPAPDFVDSIEQQRRIEILLRAVPRLCPSADETRAWVERQIESLPDHWTVNVGQAHSCALPSVDWWTHLVFT